MLIHGKLDTSNVNGPGNRAVLWVQGCTLGCPGCWNPETHGFDTLKEKDAQFLDDWIKGLKDVEGITFSGGEPMQQAAPLYLLMYTTRQNRPDLSLGMFTGYTQKELETGKYKWKSAYDGEWVNGTPELWHEIKGLLDFAIMGRYNQKVQSKTKPLCGSDNQEVVFFTNRYSEKDLSPQGVEVTVDESGLVNITGFPVGVDL